MTGHNYINCSDFFVVCIRSTKICDLYAFFGSIILYIIFLLK